MFIFGVMLASMAIGGSLGYDSGPFVPFPPAQPSQENLDALCTQGGSRPRYPSSFFPKSGYGHMRRCGSAVNRVESWYSVCCAVEKESQKLCCAKQAWEYVLKVFCREEYGVKGLPHECCEESGASRLSCFEREAPNASYQPTPDYTALEVPVDLEFAWDPKTCG
ncbi:extracellular matrix protein 1-like [Clupea harengus]|uniref:Extracellular matrix protein 1-like n=1 Tax=Clupea harengus TaxID=7950 RepID=A0A6P3VJQ4_CLUHA|nr:extracellular matrix protein 1-like [Clupea harengus]